MQGNLDAAIAMAQCLKVYRGGDGAKADGSGGKGSENRKKKEKGECGTSRGELVLGDRPSDPCRQKAAKEGQGQGQLGIGFKKDQEGRT